MYCDFDLHLFVFIFVGCCGFGLYLFGFVAVICICLCLYLLVVVVLICTCLCLYLLGSCGLDLYLFVFLFVGCCGCDSSLEGGKQLGSRQLASCQPHRATTFFTFNIMFGLGKTLVLWHCFKHHWVDDQCLQSCLTVPKYVEACCPRTLRMRHFCSPDDQLVFTVVKF